MKDLPLRFYIIDQHIDIGSLDYGEYITELTPDLYEEYENDGHFGRFAGLRYIWKNCTTDYIGFSLNGKMPSVSIDGLRSLMEAGTQVICISKCPLNHSVREEYKDKYYDYDVNILRKYLKTESPVIFPINECLLMSNEYIEPSLIIRKDVFRKFCLWAFSILDGCEESIPTRRSKIQNAALEHLGILLLSLFIYNNTKKFKYHYTDTDGIHLLNSQKTTSEICETQMQDRDLVRFTQDMLDQGKVEEVLKVLRNSKEFPAFTDIHNVFKHYAKQRRHFAQTDLDKEKDINTLIEKYRGNSIRRKEKYKVLVIEWNSINNNDTIEALKELGFDVETVYITEVRKYRNANMDRALDYLDSHHYDLVFSINYFDYISEACYVHDIPYISWAYDSPANMGDIRYARYDTSHIFLFDSDETSQYRTMGLNNVHYLPLAVNLTKYDGIKCSKDDHKKYDTSISFVGGFYETKLTEYVNYLPDYKKGFFNALLDYNTGHYDAYTIEDIFGRDLSLWLNEKSFREAVYKGESNDPRVPLLSDNIESSIAPRIGLLTNKTITNRERLILISMLSNHWDFKLYSYEKNEFIKNAEQCGKVDYYTEMPKVFKCSEINLNITYKGIKAGMPLRCLDIMGCGGFLLSNHQKDFDEHFTDGENIALFNSFDEAYEKCEYYLAHGDVRKRVAQNGYDTIREHYTYSVQLRKAIELAGLGSMLG